MPLGDGTGPLGLGPGTGRRRGRCNTGFSLGDVGRVAFRGKNRWLFGLAAPLVVAAVRDLTNPTGVLRRVASTFLRKIALKNPPSIRRDAEFSVLDEQSSEKEKQGKNNG